MKPIEHRLRRDLPALADALTRNETDSPKSIGSDLDNRPTLTRAAAVSSGRRFPTTVVTAAAALLVVFGVVGLLVVDRDGTSKVVAPVTPSQTSKETDTASLPPLTSAAPNDSLVDPAGSPGVLTADGETVESCDPFRLAPFVPVTTAVTPFVIRSGLTSSGGTWISIDDAMNRRLTSMCQNSELLLDGAVVAQLAWPIGNDVYIARIGPAHEVVPAWFNSISRYSLQPLRSIAVIGRIAPDVELPEVPDVGSEAAERERQLIDKVTQVRELRNHVASMGVVNDEWEAWPLETDGGIDGPLMYWRERPDGEQESEAALIEGVLTQEGDCLFVGEDESRSVVLWEYGTRWMTDHLAVLLPDGTTIPVGSRIEGRGGGYHAPGQLSSFTTNDAVSARAEQCVGPGGEVAVVQS